jgi:hypothetical protein
MQKPFLMNAYLKKIIKGYFRRSKWTRKGLLSVPFGVLTIEGLESRKCFFTYVGLFLSFITFVYTGCLKENGPRYSFAIDNPNEKNYTGNEMTLKALQT